MLSLFTGILNADVNDYVYHSQVEVSSDCLSDHADEGKTEARDNWIEGCKMKARITTDAEISNPEEAFQKFITRLVDVLEISISGQDPVDEGCPYQTEFRWEGEEDDYHLDVDCSCKLFFNLVIHPTKKKDILTLFVISKMPLEKLLECIKNVKMEYQLRSSTDINGFYLKTNKPKVLKGPTSHQQVHFSINDSGDSDISVYTQSENLVFMKGKMIEIIEAVDGMVANTESRCPLLSLCCYTCNNSTVVVGLYLKSSRVSNTPNEIKGHMLNLIKRIAR